MKTDELRGLALTIKKAQRGVTKRGFLKWPGPSRGKSRKKGDYIPECTSLGGTLIMLSSDYEGSVKDCEWVELACNEAPQMAAGLEMAANAIDVLTAKLLTQAATIARLRSALAAASCDLAGDARAVMVRTAIGLALAPVPS